MYQLLFQKACKKDIFFLIITPCSQLQGLCSIRLLWQTLLFLAKPSRHCNKFIKFKKSRKRLTFIFRDTLPCCVSEVVAVARTLWFYFTTGPVTSLLKFEEFIGKLSLIKTIAFFGSAAVVQESWQRWQVIKRSWAPHFSFPSVTVVNANSMSKNIAKTKSF